MGSLDINISNLQPIKRIYLEAIDKNNPYNYIVTNKLSEEVLNYVANISTNNKFRLVRPEDIYSGSVTITQQENSIYSASFSILLPDRLDWDVWVPYFSRMCIIEIGYVLKSSSASSVYSRKCFLGMITSIKPNYQGLIRYVTITAQEYTYLAARSPYTATYPSLQLSSNKPVNSSTTNTDPSQPLLIDDFYKIANDAQKRLYENVGFKYDPDMSWTVKLYTNTNHTNQPRPNPPSTKPSELLVDIGGEVRYKGGSTIPIYPQGLSKAEVFARILNKYGFKLVINCPSKNNFLPCKRNTSQVIEPADTTDRSVEDELLESPNFLNATTRVWKQEAIPDIVFLQRMALNEGVRLISNINPRVYHLVDNYTVNSNVAPVVFYLTQTNKPLYQSSISIVDKSGQERKGIKGLRFDPATFAEAMSYFESPGSNIKAVLQLPIYNLDADIDILRLGRQEDISVIITKDDKNQDVPTIVKADYSSGTTYWVLNKEAIKKAAGDDKTFEEYIKYYFSNITDIDFNKLKPYLIPAGSTAKIKREQAHFPQPSIPPRGWTASFETIGMPFVQVGYSYDIVNFVDKKYRLLPDGSVLNWLVTSVEHVISTKYIMKIKCKM